MPDIPIHCGIDIQLSTNPRIFIRCLSTLLIVFSTTTLFAQKPDTEALMEEGQLLHRLEKASWFSTDSFLANLKHKTSSLGGYLSYEDSDGSVYSIFYEKDSPYKILARYKFDNNPQPTPISLDTLVDTPIKNEADLIAIGDQTMEALSSTEKNSFSFYEGVSFNPVPIINGKEKKVYILSASQKHGAIFLGNDYLLTFNSKNKLKKIRKLHNSIIELPYRGPDGQKVTGTMHSHVLSNHIEPTDICTLLLYKEYLDWSQHYVIHKDYVSILDMEKEELLIMTRAAFEKTQN